MSHFVAHSSIASVLFRALTCAQIKRSERRRWSSEHHINGRSMNKALDILGQLRRHVAALGLPLGSCGTDPDPIRRALLAGLFMHAAVLRPDGAWLGNGALWHRTSCALFLFLCVPHSFVSRTTT